LNPGKWSPCLTGQSKKIVFGYPPQTTPFRLPPARLAAIRCGFANVSSATLPCGSSFLVVCGELLRAKIRLAIANHEARLSALATPFKIEFRAHAGHLPLAVPSACRRFGLLSSQTATRRVLLSLASV